MMWKEKANKCFPLHKSHTLSYYVLGVIGLGCSLAGFIVVCASGVSAPWAKETGATSAADVDSTRDGGKTRGAKPPPTTSGNQQH